MNFEHLIQINDLQNPLVETLNRDQVWQGLLHRVEDATPFLPGLESCTILERHADHLLRKLDFGAAVIHDRVTLVDPKKGKSTVVSYKEIERYGIDRKNSPLK